MSTSLFDLEVREKKFQASLNRSRAGKKGASKSRKGVATPYDFMNTTEKKKLNGEVKVSNMYSTILNWNEFQMKDKETQKNLLEKWREIHSNTKIMEELQVGRPSRFNSQSFADLVNDLGVSKKQRGSRSGVVKEKTEKRKYTKRNTSDEFKLPAATLETEQKQEIQEEVLKQVIISKGLHLEFNGAYDVESLNRLFTKLQLLVDGEPCKYNISLSLTEIEEK